jgi:hypothetical protein
MTRTRLAGTTKPAVLHHKRGTEELEDNMGRVGQTHYEIITENIEEAAAVLCRHTECDKGCAAEWCSPGHNGMKHWLEMEDYEDDN